MQKRTSTHGLDAIQNARRVVLESVGERPIAPSTQKISASLVSQVMAEMGRKGGQIGGKRRLVTLTPERRHEIAVQAAKVRWKATAKKKGGK